MSAGFRIVYAHAHGSPRTNPDYIPRRGVLKHPEDYAEQGDLGSWELNTEGKVARQTDMRAKRKAAGSRRADRDGERSQEDGR